MMKKHIFFCFFALIYVYSEAQMTTGYNVELFGSAATGEHTPFWTVNHRWGVVPLESGNGYVRGGVFHKQNVNFDWSFDAGIDVVAVTAGSYGNLWLQQLYTGLNWKTLRIEIGMREDYVSLLNSQLSSGDFINANHARPVPQIKGSIPDFILVPYTKGNLYIKGEIAVGKYLDGDWLAKRAEPALQEYAGNILSHDKSVYFRFGNIAKQRQQFTFGMVHKAQWGGVLYQINNQKAYYLVDQPQNLEAFLRMFIAKEGSGNASGADQAYVSGSQWGAYLFRYDYKLKNSRFSAYIQHFFEDGTGMVFENYPDNLYGLEFSFSRKSLVSGVVLEYIYAKQQTGTIHLGDLGDDRHIRPIDKGGNDNYYNNVDYTQGPSHFGKTLGTPLFLSPEYNTAGNVNFQGTRMIACHLGLEGYFRPELQYRLLLTTGKNWGRYYVPFSSLQKGFASQMELIYNCPEIDGFSVRLSGGYDVGEFFGGNTFGGSITLSKKGIIYKK